MIILCLIKTKGFLLNHCKIWTDGAFIAAFDSLFHQCQKVWKDKKDIRHDKADKAMTGAGDIQCKERLSQLSCFLWHATDTVHLLSMEYILIIHLLSAS